jgi:AhpD family alkylhydroperoxidase
MRLPAIAPGSKPELADIEARILAERGRISPLYQVLLNSPAIAHGWEQMLSAVRNRSSLSDRLKELIILRVAVINRAPYEFEAHAPLAVNAGVSQDTLDALMQAEIGQDAQLSDIERKVLALTDAMTRDIAVSEPLYQAVAAHFSHQNMLDIVATVAAYNMVSRLLEALHIGH